MDQSTTNSENLMQPDVGTWDLLHKLAVPFDERDTIFCVLLFPENDIMLPSTFKKLMRITLGPSIGGPKKVLEIIPSIPLLNYKIT
jgi:hypothetical protein